MNMRQHSESRQLSESIDLYTRTYTSSVNWLLLAQGGGQWVWLSGVRHGQWAWFNGVSGLWSWINRNNS